MATTIPVLNSAAATFFGHVGVAIALGFASNLLQMLK